VLRNTILEEVLRESATRAVIQKAVAEATLDYNFILRHLDGGYFGSGQPPGASPLSRFGQLRLCA